MRDAIRKAAAQRLIEFGKCLRETGTPEIAEAELDAELKAVRAELRQARARMVVGYPHETRTRR